MSGKGQESERKGEESDKGEESGNLGRKQKGREKREEKSWEGRGKRETKHHKK